VARPEGGSGALPEALAACVRAAGGEVRTGARVVEVLAEGGRVRGVRLEGGEVVEAPVVVAAADPRSALVRWLARPPASALPLVRRWRARPQPEGYESKVDAVVARRPRLRAVDEALLGRLGVPDPLVPTVMVLPGLEGMARAHRAMARGEVAERPMLWLNVPSVVDPTMRAGDGDVLSLEVLFTPYRLRGGWEGSGEPRRWLDALCAVVEPGFREAVRRWRAVTPPDYERDFGLERGHAPGFSGTPLSVLLGRDRELTRYETPVRGLFLTGAGTFPGAGVWGASGRNAASVVLRRWSGGRG
jgi:phytoene dehydrogenase-like protein